MEVIVTGASHGIGMGIARVLGRNGCTVGLVARSADKIEALAEEIQAAGGRAVAAPCDLRDHAAVEETFPKLIEQLGGLYGLINNAGLVTRKPVHEISLDEWHDMVNVNLNGLFYATRAVLPTLRARKEGHIINISSISGKMPLPGGSGYAATKFAVTGFSQSIFQELRDDGIKTSVVFPGSVDSESHRHDPDADHGWKVQPEEVGEACLSLLRTRQGNCISELEIRPLNRAPKK